MMDSRITHHPVMNFFDAQLLTTLQKVYKMTETGKKEQSVRQIVKKV